MTSKPLELERVKVTEIEEGTILVIRIPIGSTREEFDRINKYLEKRIPDREFILLPENIPIELLKSKDLENLGLKKIAG